MGNVMFILVYIEKINLPRYDKVAKSPSFPEMTFNWLTAKSQTQCTKALF